MRHVKRAGLYWSAPVGRNNVLFAIPKFRTIRLGTAAVASHLLPDPHSALTPMGPFLCKISLNELPLALKVVLDREYLRHRSFFFDTRILGLTFIKVFKSEVVSH